MKKKEQDVPQLLAKCLSDFQLFLSLFLFLLCHHGHCTLDHYLILFKGTALLRVNRRTLGQLLDIFLGHVEKERLVQNDPLHGVRSETVCRWSSQSSWIFFIQWT